MIERFTKRILLLILGGSLTLSLSATELAARSASAGKAALPTTLSGSTNSFRPLSPGPADGQIAFVTARLLERFHYLRQPFNTPVSSKFFDRYLEALDPQHLHFLQSDLSEFESYRTNLDRLTLLQTDTRPACEIFNRFMQRLDQRVAYADQLLQHEKFTFDTNERILINRKDAPYPKNLDEARKLWRERLRFEYLQERLGKIDAKKKAAATAKTADAVTEAKPKKSEAEDIIETLSHRYHRNLRTFADWDSDDVLQVYLTTLAHTYDPHSDYFGHAQLDSFAIGMNLSLFGI
ncbi:MAG TPA: hypothetical protein VNT26_05135, partial [Candidatus Sulfotelmatobacter sp.]|nr:hypothetical protein [Candidatus Sulfotelmatobacter sp.]